MSPTEFELRAALRSGEDETGGLDADAIVRRAGELRRQRRARVGGGLAAAAVVVGVAVTGGVLIGSGDSQRNDGSSAAGGAAQPTNAAPGADAKGSSRGTDRSAAGAPNTGYAGAGIPDACPATAPRLLLPGGGGTGQFGGTESLLVTDVSAVVICGYGSSEAPHAPNATTVSGAAARALAASLNGAPAVHQGICPQFRTADTAQFVLVGVTADGARGAPVVVTLGANPCQSQATNGTAVRYGWTPPASLTTHFPLTTGPTPQHS